MVKLRKWQEEAKSIWLSSQQGVVAVVTGAGKTVFALACAEEAMKRGLARRVLVVVPSIPLQDQWAVAIKGTSLPDLDRVGMLGGGRRLRSPERVTVAVLGSASRYDWGAHGSASTMLIVDECHHVATEQNRKLLDHQFGPRLGLSATPERQYDKFFETYVSPHLGSIFYRYEYKRALADGVISPFNFVNIRLPLTEAEDDELQALTSKIRRLAALEPGTPDSREQLRRLLLRRMQRSNAISARRASVWPTVSRLGLKRGIVFVDTIESCEAIATDAPTSRLSVRAYHSHQTRVQRQTNLELYTIGQVDILVTCTALDEGFDVPRTEFALLCASTASVRRRVQRMGRALRPSPGKDSAQVVSFYALESERRVLEEAVADNWEAASARWMEVRSS